MHQDRYFWQITMNRNKVKIHNFLRVRSDGSAAYGTKIYFRNRHNLHAAADKENFIR